MGYKYGRLRYAARFCMDKCVFLLCVLAVNLVSRKKIKYSFVFHSPLDYPSWKLGGTQRICWFERGRRHQCWCFLFLSGDWARIFVHLEPLSCVLRAWSTP